MRSKGRRLAGDLVSYIFVKIVFWCNGMFRKKELSLWSSESGNNEQVNNFVVDSLSPVTSKCIVEIISEVSFVHALISVLRAAGYMNLIVFDIQAILSIWRRNIIFLQK